MKITGYADHEHTADEGRLQAVLAALRGSGWHTDTPRKMGVSADSDVFLTQRLHRPEDLLAWCAASHTDRTLLVADLDVDLFREPGEFWQDPQRRLRIQAWLRLADVVTVPSWGMADAVRISAQITRQPVLVLPTARLATPGFLDLALRAARLAAL